jgi:predicted esterase
MRAIVLVVLCALPAAADTLHLKSGGKVEGKIVGEENGRYRVQLAKGEILVAKEDVVKIEYGPAPVEELEKRRKTLDPKDAKAVVELAKWAASKGFSEEALAIARSGEAPECRALVLSLIEPEVARRVEEARKSVRLGLVRRAKAVVDELIAAYPEARERATAVIPEEPKRRHRYYGLERPDPKLEEAVNAYFADGTPLKTDAALPQVLAAIRRGARGGDAPKPGIHKMKTKDGAEYLLRMPEGYDPEVPMPMLFSMHGSSNTAAAQYYSWANGLRDDRDFVVVFPEGGLLAWGNATACHERVFAIMRDVAARVTIDPDGICLDGGSWGGHGAFLLAMTHPGRWAAIAPRVGTARFANYSIKAGVPDSSAAPPQLANLWDLPVYLVAGAKDDRTPIEEARATRRKLESIGAPLVYREYEDGGHEWFPTEDGDVLDFLRHHRRNPYPKRVKLVTREALFNRCSWIEILSVTRTERIEIAHLDMRQQPLETRKEYDKCAEVDAEADRAKNRITIRTQGVRDLRVWLADELVDLDKPIELVVNGEKPTTMKAERSLQAAMEDCRKRGDRGAPFVASVKVTVR